MKLNRILLTTVALLLFAALASAAPPPAQTGAPALDAFLSSLSTPATPSDGSAVTPVNQASCGPSFCTQAQRDACTQQCLAHGHGPFVGLECCSNCTTLCICGSRPVAC